MSQSKYIKVTPKGEKEGRVVLATLKSFFVSQGAKIETPTQEEIEAAFPEERKVGAMSAQPQPSQPEVNATIADQKATIERQAELITKLEEELKTVKEEREKAYDQVAALGKSLDEAEQLIEKLKADADKSAEASSKKKGE